MCNARDNTVYIWNGKKIYNTRVRNLFGVIFLLFVVCANPPSGYYYADMIVRDARARGTAHTCLRVRPVCEKSPPLAENASNFIFRRTHDEPV